MAWGSHWEKKAAGRIQGSKLCCRAAEFWPLYLSQQAEMSMKRNTDAHGRKGIHMRKWVKRLTAAMPVLLLLVTLAGCGEIYGYQQNEGTRAEELSAEPEETEGAEEPPESEPAEDPTPAPAGDAVPEQAKVRESAQKTAGDMAVHFLDVGQGLSIFVQSGGQNLIYDGGDRDTSSFVVSYLQQQNVTRLDYVISSHYDSDHVYGLIGCIDTFDVGTVICSDYDHDTETSEKFADAAAAKGLEMQHPAVGTEFDFGTGSFTVLAPAAVSDSDSNDNSVAIKLTNGENSFIFTGDAEADSEAAMCASGIDLDCDVIVPGHHGSATGTSWEFLEHTVPEYAVISCGKGNQYGHPDKDTMDKLESMEIQVYRTDQQGTIIAVSDGTDIEWNQEPCNDYSPGDEGDTGTQPGPMKKESNGQAAGSFDAGQTVEAVPAQEEQVWISATGSKYHNKPDCGNMNPDNAYQMSREEAEADGYEPCKKCY